MNNMVCPYCGGKLLSGKSFCPGCGATLQESSTRSIKKGALGDLTILFGLAAVVLVGFSLFSPSPDLRQPQPSEFNHPPISGAPKGAEAELQKVISGLPTDVDSLIMMGNHFMDNRIYPMAIECYRRALRIDSANANVLTDLGACYHASGASDKAIESFERAIAAEPNHSAAHFNLGVVYHGLNNPQMAKYYWEKFIELEPQSPMADTIRKFIIETGGN
jgi:cytochrome c-type biogenesis protein CcmH/NrfG